MSVQLSQSLLNLSPFNHVPELPGGEITATSLIWLVAGAATLVAVGLPDSAAATLRAPDVGGSAMKADAGPALVSVEAFRGGSGTFGTVAALSGQGTFGA